MGQSGDIVVGAGRQLLDLASDDRFWGVEFSLRIVRSSNSNGGRWFANLQDGSQIEGGRVSIRREDRRGGMSAADSEVW